MHVWVDGEPADEFALSVRDWSFLRGDGCFEALRSYDGDAFAIEEHVTRLGRSAAALDMTLPPAADIGAWIATAARTGGAGVVRVVATRGAPNFGLGSRVVVLWEPLPVMPATWSLQTVVAPWHAAGRPWALAGAKTLSYAPNLAAARQARNAGADDALLLSDDRTVLEGPTFSIGWVIGGTVETPSLDLAILDSITRRTVLDGAARSGLAVEEGRWPVERLEAADEVFVLSTLKEVGPVTRVDAHTFPEGPVTKRLQSEFAASVQSKLPHGTTST